MKASAPAAGRHPSSAEFDAFLEGQLAGPPAWRVLWHWLLCPECREIPNPLSAVGGHPLPPPAYPPEAYDAPIERAFRAAIQDKAAVERALIDLRRGGDPALESDLSVPVRVAAQLAHSWELRFTNAKEMLRYAELAATDALAHRNDVSGKEDTRQREDLAAKALTEYANALRVNNRLRVAQEQLGRAFSCLGRGTGDKFLSARIIDIQATLLADQRLYEAAHALLDCELEIFHRNGSPSEAGRVLISKAKCYVDAQNPEKGIELSQQALRLLDPKTDPDLELAARFNLAWALAEAGRFPEARRSVWGLAKRFRERGHEMSALRSRWLEGKIRLGLGDAEKAAREFEAVRAGFADLKFPYDTSLVSLELAIALRELHRWAEAHEVLLEAIEEFHKLALGDYFRMALAQFQDLFEIRSVQSAALIQIVAVLRQANEDAKRDGLRSAAAWRWRMEREDELDRRDRDEAP